MYRSVASVRCIAVKAISPGLFGKFDLLGCFAPPDALSGNFFEEAVPCVGDKVGEAPPRGQERRPLRNRLVYGRIDDPAGVPGLFGDEPEIREASQNRSVEALTRVFEALHDLAVLEIPGELTYLTGGGGASPPRFLSHARKTWQARWSYFFMTS